MRRGRWLVAGATAAALIMAVGCGAQPSPSTSPTAAGTAGPTAAGSTGSGPTAGSTATPSQPPSSSEVTPSASATDSATAGSCQQLAASLSRNQQIGQLLMVAVSSEGLTSSGARAINDVDAGSVILLGNSQRGVTAIRTLTRDVLEAVNSPKRITTLIAADQEGGQVQRLRGPGFDRIPSAVDQAELSDSRLATDAETWGRQLKEAGIDANLAPVADVVPKSMITSNEPIGRLQRGYGSDPAVVADKTAAFVKGMQAAGIATSVKHFPGLGAVRGNTDFSADVVDDQTTRDDSDLAGFSASIEAGTDMVMVSSAIYSKIDPDQVAAFSTKIITRMIREDRGFGGVVISDDLAAEAVAAVPPGTRATRFLSAGGDMIILGDQSELSAMVKGIRVRAQSDPAFAERITRSAARVLELKARHGLADCG